MARGNPFGDREKFTPERVNPFGDEHDAPTTEESIRRIQHAARTIRRLKSQLGGEGLTIAATRELIDELSRALDATAQALTNLSGSESD
ncbi:MAG: hypothetical protein WEF86_13525 [Gemmatimonadota bacterium]